MIIVGDALSELKRMETESVDCCITSPPYYNLRDYGIDGQIGLETIPEEYISKLVDVFREVRRVLKQDGTLWLNIGDSYAGSGKGKKDTHTTNKGNKGSKNNSALQGNFRSAEIKPKDLIGIPWLLAFALRNDGWYLRQDIIWQKPNCMPESVKDRCTKSHEYIFLLSKSPKYYFDGEAISEPIADSTVKRCSQNIAAQKGSDRQPGKSNGNMKACLPRYGGRKYTEDPDKFYRTKSHSMYDFRPRRNKRDVWSISTCGFKGAHLVSFLTLLRRKNRQNAVYIIRPKQTVCLKVGIAADLYCIRSAYILLCGDCNCCVMSCTRSCTFALHSARLLPEMINKPVSICVADHS